jgi:hypothetical protein
LGQTEKNSGRANVFRFALKLGHCSMHSACLKGANSRSKRIFGHVMLRFAGEFGLTPVARTRLGSGVLRATQGDIGLE